MSTNNVSSGESDEDSQVVIKSSRKTKRCLSESEDEAQDKTTPENNVHTTTPRSSERLRKKSQRVYSVPSRKETLDKIAVKDVKYEDRNLRPRRLTSDFVRGLNRYVTDRIETFESDDSPLSDFIDDSEVTTHRKSRRSSKKARRNSGEISDEIVSERKDDNGQITTSRKSRRKKNIELSSDEEVQSEDKNDINNEVATRTRTRKCKKTKELSPENETQSCTITTRTRSTRKQKQKAEQSSSDDAQAEENIDCEITTSGRKRRLKKTQHSSLDDKTKPRQASSGEDSSIEVETLRKKKVNKHGKCLSSVSDDDKSSSSEDKDSEHIKLQKSKRRSISNKIDSADSDEELEPNRKLLKRTKSAKKEKEEALLAKLTAKRKMEKVKLEQQNNKKDTDTNVVENKDMVDDSRILNETLNELENEKRGIQEDVQNVLSYDTEETQDNNVLDSADIFEEGESDREFVVDNDYADSDGVTEFFKHLHNADNAVGNDSLKLKENKSNSFQRIYIPVESDDSDNENVVESTTLDVCEAIKENNIESVISALETNPNIVHELGPKRCTLLHCAVMSGTSEITKLLLSSNADTFAKDSYSLQPIAYALLTGHIDCLRLLLKYTDLKELNKMCKLNFKFSLLHFVIYGQTSFPDLKCEVVGDSGLVQCLRILFECDEALFFKLMKEKDSRGFTPLVAAIIAGNSQCVEYLLYNGALMDDYRSLNGGSLLHLAVECSLESEQVDKASCLKVLLQTSLRHKVDYGDNSGFTPLMYAAQSGNHDCVLALLEAGASVSCRDLHGTTSLHLAAASGDTQSVKLLLQYGHQVDCLDSCGWPPLLYANFAAQESCVLSLMEPNPKQIFVLGDLLKRGTSEAAKERNFKVVKDVLIALANQDAYYRVFNDFIRRNPNFLDEYDRGLLHKTWRALLDYDNKLRWFKRKLASLRRDDNYQYILLEVDREAVFESAMKKLDRFNGRNLRDCQLDVTFKNEAGICTGPKREFFVNICKDIVGERHQLFHLTDDNQYSFIPNAYFAEMAKVQGGAIKDEKSTLKHSSESIGNSQSSQTMESSGSQYVVQNLTGSSRAGFTQSSVTTNSNESHDIVGDSTGSSCTVAGFSQPTSADRLERTSSDRGTLRDNNVLQSEILDSSSFVTGSSETNFQECTQRSSSDNTLTDTLPSTAVVASADFMDERGDIIIANLDTTDVNPSASVESCPTVDPSISLDTTRDPIVVVSNLSTVNMDEIEDAIIAELDVNTSPSVNSSTNVDSNEQSCTTVEQANTSMDTVENSTEGHNPSMVYMDEGGDTIIAELDTSEIDACSKESQANAEIDKIPAVTAEIKKQEFARHVDQKLTKNISQLKFLGRIIGTAIFEGFFINLHLCKPLVKQILGMKLSHPDDLSSFDYKLHENLVTFVLESDEVEDLELPCTLDVLNPWNKHLTTLTLFSDERNEELLNEKNKVEYVDLVSQHKLTVLIKKEMAALCQGLYEVIPKSLFSVFTADEFSLLINGVGKIDVEDWRKNTVYTPRDAASTYNEIKWFWEVVNELKEDEKALLLKFSTGSPCLPAGGFSQLQGLGGATKFHISMKSECNKIPTASTCFNQLKLPKYDNIKDLKDKLLIAIRHGTEGFSFS